MASATEKVKCIKCEKEKCVARCYGCLKSFCYNHFEDHRQELNKQLDELEVSRDCFRQILTEQETKPEKHPLIEKIEQWEYDSIEKIRQTAEEAKELLLKSINQYFADKELKLNNLTIQLRRSREENDFSEKDLQHWEGQLTQLKEELNRSSTDINVRESTALVNKLYIDTTSQACVPNIPASAKWIQNGITVAGNNGHGSSLNQLWDPYGIYVDYDQTIYIAEYGNHRISEWKNGGTSGQIIAGGNSRGSEINQLCNPTNVLVDKEHDSLIICDRINKRVVRWSRRNGARAEILISNMDCYGLAMDNNGYLYVSDQNRHEVIRWKRGDTSRVVVAGGNGKGGGLDQLNAPTYIIVDRDHSVYITDNENHRVMKWIVGAKEGVVVAGGQGKGNNLKQLSHPGGIAVDQSGTVYVADYKNDRIMRWSKGATQGTVVVGGNGSGKALNQFNGPWDLAFDQHNNLYVVDYWNQRVQKFYLDSNSIS